MPRRGRDDLRGSPRRPVVPEDDHDDGEPSGERVSLVRWGRIWAGILLIVAGVVWLAIDNALGIYTTSSSSTATPAGQPLPALGTAQSTGAAMVNAKEVGYYPSLSGKPAPAGERYLVIAVQVANRSAAALTLRPQQFSLWAHSATLAGDAYTTGHATLFVQPLAPRATAEGYLTFRTSSGTTSGVLRYAPSAGAQPLSWRVG